MHVAWDTCSLRLDESLWCPMLTLDGEAGPSGGLGPCCPLFPHPLATALLLLEKEHADLQLHWWGGVRQGQMQH